MQHKSPGPFNAGTGTVSSLLLILLAIHEDPELLTSNYVQGDDAGGDWARD